MTDLKVKKKVLTAAEAAGLTEHEAALSAHIVKSLVPDPDILDKYEHRKIGGYTDFEVLDVARALQHNVLLGGPTGSGKSLLFRAYGAHHGVPVATVSCSGASDPATWFGSYRPFPNPDGTPGFVAYGASKWAVRGMTRGVAKELAPFGVRVNSIHPGIIDTPMLQTFDAAGEGVREMVRTRIPLGYEAEPIHVARLALYLASDDSAYSTGSEFKVDGGWSA